MALQFPNEWRFNDDLGRMPAGAVAELTGLIEKVATSAPNAKSVYEAVKHRFGNVNNSSNESWAQSDMRDAIGSAELNTPEFIEAYWTAFTEMGDAVPTPPPEKINAILRKHSVGYVINPPHLMKEVGAAIAAAAEASGGTTMPGYTVGERLGGGTFGEVFAASRRTPFCDFEFAVKFHNPSAFANRDRALSRFEREVMALGKLQHRAIVAYTDAGVDPSRGLPFLVMARIKGTNLRDATEGQPAHVTVRHLIEVLGAISYAHAHGVLHRDLKPSNVLVRASDAQAVIVDFGLAYLLDDLSPTELTLSTVGTAPYVPHESLVNPKTRSPAHDIYSCGIMLYELLARRLPDLSNYLELARIDRNWAPLDPILKRALAPVDARYSSAAEFQGELVNAWSVLSQPGAW